ncbi:hypothetical protein [Caulobacter ginsengisoli]|uniref:hypothetical protein n=1 Tax=Caulobacter ginsengisoli TaxID=400775 RepID=UPI0027D85C6B|nr:hypothetical protein [Caulobacter ginsengisoli]
MRLEEYAFDYLLYPFMLYRGGGLLVGWLRDLFGQDAPAMPATGYWFGLGLMTAASIALNLIYVRAYDRMRTDWFGFEALKRAQENLIPSRFRVGPWRTAARFTAFVYLSAWHNPLFATLFMRRASASYAMSEGDWPVFWSAVLIANLGWAGIVSGAVEAAKAVLRLIG